MKHCPVCMQQGNGHAYLYIVTMNFCLDVGTLYDNCFVTDEITIWMSLYNNLLHYIITIFNTMCFIIVVVVY